MNAGVVKDQEVSQNGASALYKHQSIADRSLTPDLSKLSIQGGATAQVTNSDGKLQPKFAKGHKRSRSEEYKGHVVSRSLSHHPIEYNIARAELEKENSHFIMSEALIATVEQAQYHVSRSSGGPEESDSEPIVRPCQRRVLRTRKLPQVSLLSDGYTDTTTDQSISSDDIKSSSELSSDEDDRQSVTSFKLSEAESIAFHLWQEFRGKQLPWARQALDWLVSEAEAPQKLLPLPTSWPVNPDEIFHKHGKTRLRGTFDWAPPRPQFIFTLFPKVKLKEALKEQGYRCAGCGMKSNPKYAKQYRYCHYLSKYFCSHCHTNQTAIIPAKILWEWDFSSLRNLIDPLRGFLIDNPDLYSVHLLVQVKTGEKVKQLEKLVQQATDHVYKCELCRARGHFCEICHGKDIIFPFEIQRVRSCQRCQACFHDACFTNKCPRCIRRGARSNKEM